jgi:hypothetical protein
MQSADCKAKEKTDDAQISERTTNESIRCNIGKWSNGLSCSTKQKLEKVGCSSSTVETSCNIFTFTSADIVVIDTQNTLFTKYLALMSSRKV